MARVQTADTAKATTPASLNAAQIAAAIAALPAAEQAVLRKSVKETTASAKAETRGKVTGVAADAKDATVLLIDVKLGSAPGNTGDGRAYLFQADGVRFQHGGKTWRMSAIYATEDKTA